MNNTNNLTAEMAYQKAKDIFWNAMIDTFRKMQGLPISPEQACTNWVNALKLSQSEIRLECEFSANFTTYQFGLTQNQANSTGVPFNTENRLTMQDSLVCNEYGIYVANPSSRTDTTFKLETFANTNATTPFPAADALAINSTFYNNGFFRMTCNNDVVMPYRGLFNHFYIPQTQQTAALAPASPADQIRGAEDGMITMQPNMLLIGSKGYIPEIKIPAALAITAGQFSRIILLFRGVLAQNSTSVS